MGEQATGAKESNCSEANRDCCCNCKHQKPLHMHPSNGEKLQYGFLPDRIRWGKGAIISQCGWVCTAAGHIVFHDFEHALCEMHEKADSKELESVAFRHIL